MLPASRRALVSPASHRRAVNLAKRVSVAAAIPTSSGKLTFARKSFVVAVEEPSESADVASSQLPKPKKRGNFLRRTVLYSALFGVTFYGGSTVIALNNDRFRDFFNESVPLGEAIMEYAESQGWDEVRLSGLPKRALEGTKDMYSSVEGAVSRTIGSAPSIPENKDTRSSVKSTVQGTGSETKKSVSSGVVFVRAKVEEVGEAAKSKGNEVANDLKDLVEQAEKALSTGTIFKAAAEARTGSTPMRHGSGVEYYTPSPHSPSDTTPYTTPLPLGHEPPPGYGLPSQSKTAIPQKSAKKSKIRNSESDPVPPFPLVAPAVKDLSASEPVIEQLATRIDGLAALLRDSPASAAGARDILGTAKVDLVALGSRIEAVRKEERANLEIKLGEQASEYSTQLLQLEVDSQDKIDAQEEGFKAMLDEERQHIINSYRQKLVNELETQSELINQRLKEEVVAQGIEMQRRWIREIKVRVEEERGGRLAKLGDLATGLKKLERVTLDNSILLDDNMRLHTLWSAVRAFTTAVDGTVRRPFREELRVLRNATGARADPVINSILDTIDASDVPDVGVEPLGDLIQWFTTSVAPRVESVALVPDADAGVLSYLASSVLSTLRFKRQGLVQGDDVSSVIARAEHYLNEKDLDGAARELNQLKGASKLLLSDWLAAARKRLEVEQALEVIRSQATLSSLLAV